MILLLTFATRSPAIGHCCREPRHVRRSEAKRRYLLGRLIKMATPDPRPFRLDAVLGERGARAVQLWPADGATSVSLLLEVLNERADAEPDPERQGRLRRAASAAEDVGTDILAKTITEFLARVAGAP